MIVLFLFDLCITSKISKNDSNFFSYTENSRKCHLSRILDNERYSHLTCIFENYLESQINGTNSASPFNEDSYSEDSLDENNNEDSQSEDSLDENDDKCIKHNHNKADNITPNDQEDNRNTSDEYVDTYDALNESEKCCTLTNEGSDSDTSTDEFEDTCTSLEDNTKVSDLTYYNIWHGRDNYRLPQRNQLYEINKNDV
ncbi:uncharacterized protein VNE69_04077 [Vairimorpha necatrix]|uniref:Uncharacterized protein n=1 Tax=Vairimorpha necatrix TaxID=6039 RepID=A0AAX4JBB6_9MICR